MKRIGISLLILIILIFNFIIGANEKGLRVLPIAILMAAILIYLIIKKVKEPKESLFFRSNIDYFVLAFMITTALPLIFSTYSSYSSSVEFILKYFFIYSVYVLARNTITEKNDVENIITATLICSLIPIILGLDYNNGKYLEWIVKKLNLVYTDSNLFSATFGYANALSIYLSLCLFLAIYKIKNTGNKVLKVTYIIYGLFISYIIWITISRAIIALLLITLAIYFIVDNRQRILKHWKKIFLVASILLAIGVPFMTYALHVSEPFTITKETYTDRMKFNFKGEEKYTLELDMEAYIKSETLKDIAFELEIIQANKYFKETKIAYKRFGRLNGKIALEFTPEKDFTYLNLRICNDFHGTVKIRHCYINGEEYMLNYKYLPKQLGKMFSEYSLNEKSIKERLFIYRDCLEMAKESPIIGHGGDAWKNLSTAYQDYTVILKESHSYLFELLISYGIIGLSAFLTIVIALFVKLLKQIKSHKEKTPIAIGLFFLLIYSIVFDFNMSFMLIQLMVYIYMAALIYDEQEKHEILKWVDYLILTLLVCIFSVYIRANIAEYLVEDIGTKQSIASYKNSYKYDRIIKEIKAEEYISALDDIQKFIKEEPYYNQTEVYRMYFGQIYKNIEKFSDEELENYLNFGITKLKTIKFSEPLFIEKILVRAISIEKMIEKLEEYESKLEDGSKTKEILKSSKKELQKIIDAEYEVNIKNLKEKDKLGYKDAEIEGAISEYLKIIKKGDL